MVGTLTDERNAIGAHSGSYSLYRALAVAAGNLDPVHKPDLTDTSPAAIIGPNPQWGDPERIVSLDPYGHLVSEAFAGQLEQMRKDHAAIVRLVDRLPESDRAMLPDVVPTVNALFERASELARMLQQMEGNVDHDAMDVGG